MTLKAGEPLQNGKYVVQAVLDQSDFGVTYEARHTLLDQIVFLQTFNDTVRQRSDFASLRQQFLTRVRSISQRSIDLRVLDCFEEDTLPYVVLQAIPGKVPHLNDWLTLLPEARQADVQQADVQQAIAQKPEEQKPDTPVFTAKAISEEPAATSAPQAFPPEAVPLSTAVLAATEWVGEAVPPSTNGATQNGTLGRLPQTSQPKRPIPIPLLIAILGGLGLGAGAGFALRFQPSGSLGQAPHLFGQEQDFPSQGDWPITEIPNRLSSEPKVEEPLYRVKPVPDYYSPLPQPIYSPKTDFSSPPPVLPPESPEAKSDGVIDPTTGSKSSSEVPSPAPQGQAIDSAPLPPFRNNFDSAPNVQPSAAPAPVNPAPNAPGVDPERAPKLLKPRILNQ